MSRLLRTIAIALAASFTAAAPAQEPTPAVSPPDAARQDDGAPLPRLWPLQWSWEGKEGELENHWAWLFSDPEAHRRAARQALALPEDQRAGAADGSRLAPWQPVGNGLYVPSHTNPALHFYNRHKAGRVSALHYGRGVEGSLRLYLGASGGGLWELDPLAGWVPLSDNLPGPPSVGSFAVHRDDGRKILLGTGDSGRYPGDGLFRTTDHGVTWNRVAMTPGVPDSAPDFIHAIVPNPRSPDTVLVATSRGIWRSTDFGATGSWVYTSRVTDIEFDPGYAAGTRWLAGAWGVGVLESLDNGASFTPTGAVFRSPVERVELAIAHANPRYVFALVSGYGLCCIPGGACSEAECHVPAHCELHDPYTECRAAGAERLNNVYRSSDSGFTFDPIELIDMISWGLGHLFAAIASDPEDADRLFVAMSSMQWTDNATAEAGVSWHRWHEDRTTPCDLDHDGTIDPAPPATAACDMPLGHPDHSAFEFRNVLVPGATIVYVANDGGYFAFDHLLNTLSGSGNLGLGLNISQTMQPHGALAGSYLEPGLLLAGMQDTGMIRIEEGAAQPLTHIGGGDGGQSAISPRNTSDFFFSSGADYNRYYSPDAGGTWKNIECGLDLLWAESVTTAPHPDFGGPPRIYTHGHSTLWFKPVSDSCDWEMVNPTDPLPPSYHAKQLDLACHESDNVFYVTAWGGPRASGLGEDDNRLRVFDTGALGSMTGAWRTPPDVIASPPTNWEDALVFADRSVRQPDTVYYTTASSRPSRAFVSLSDLPVRRGRGRDWVQVTGNLATALPDADYLELVANPANPNEMFLATSVGLFRTTNALSGTPIWYRYMTGLPKVAAVIGLELNYDRSPSGNPILHIGTYGRGFWKREVVNISMRGGSIPGARGIPGAPLILTRMPSAAMSDILSLDWSPSCAVGDTDYAVYEGALGDFQSHAAVLCSTGGQTSASILAEPGNRYFLVAPLGRSEQGWTEGSLGTDSVGNERPQASNACQPRDIRGCS